MRLYDMILDRPELLQLPGGGDGGDVPGGLGRHRKVDADREVVIVTRDVLVAVRAKLLLILIQTCK